MLKITLPQGKIYHLAVKSSVELVHGRGTYGNGSIDWGKEGLTVAEIIAQIAEAPADVLAVLIEDKLCMPSTFITEDATIQWVTAKDALGKDLRRRTGIFLLGYGLNSLHRGYRRLQGGVDGEMLYYDFLPPEDGITNKDFQACQTQVAQALQSGETIKPRKVSYYEAMKYFDEQGEENIKQYIEENDDGGAVSLQTFGAFAQLDTGVLLADLQQIQDLRVVSLEKTAKGCRLIGKLAF